MKIDPRIPPGAQLFEHANFRALLPHLKWENPQKSQSETASILLRDGYRYTADGVLVFEEPGKPKTSKSDLLTVADVCVILKLGQTKVKELIASRALPSMKVGGRARRVRRSTLERFMADREAGRRTR